jgi:hypothetical protein
MNYHVNQFYIKLFLILLFGFYSCKSTAEITPGNKADSRRRSIEENYKPYQSMVSNITLSGYIDKKNFSYPGKILVENIDKTDSQKSGQSKNLKVQLTVHDPVFLSPLLKISLISDNLYYKDYLQNKEESLGYHDSGIYFMSSHIMPSNVLLPLFIGMLPDEFMKKEIKIQKDGTYLYTSERYILTGTFTENTLTELTLKNNNLQTPIAIKLEGKKSNVLNRTFPEKIIIELPSNEKIQILYHNLKIQ